MKKLFSVVLIALAALVLSSCDTSPKVFNYYFIGSENWQGADDATYDAVAKVLINSGYLNSQVGFNIEGDDVNKNDELAIDSYESKVQSINDGRADIEERLKGMGTDGKEYTVSFVYSLSRQKGTGMTRLKEMVLQITVPAK